MTKDKTSGFTLIELSIVLVIIGLIVGGVLTARDLIRAAELRGVIDESTKIKTAINTFITKYNCKPGDCANATMFFGINANGCPAGDSTTGTCNGDGNGRLCTAGVQYFAEWFRVWQHLGQAGLISGSYTGVTGPSGTLRHTIPGTNVPSSKISGAGYSFYCEVNISPSHTDRFVSQGDKDSFEFGMPATISTNVYETYAGAIRPVDALSIDTKLDDGRPSTGKVGAFKANGYGMPGCTTTDDPLTTLYNGSRSDNVCGLVFLME